MYDDAGTGLGYEHGQYTDTPISDAPVPGGSAVVIGPARGSYPGAQPAGSLDLNAPSGWTVTPTTATTASSVASGSSLTASRSVTGPVVRDRADAGGDAVRHGQVHRRRDRAAGDTHHPAADHADHHLGLAVDRVGGQVVTVSGVNFGATQGSSYITFSDGGTNWGAPPDTATFSLDSWSDNQITFTIPSPSSSGAWHVVPGSTATATVTVTTSKGATSSTASLTIGSG